MVALAQTSTQRSAEAGVTLIEVLVVMAVIGVAAGTTMLGVNASDRRSRAETEAVRLAQNLALSVDEAMITGRDHALVWDEKGYRFERYDAQDGWVAAQVPVLAQRHDVRAPMTMARLDGREEPVQVLASAIGPQTVVLIKSNSMSWVVSFDGFTATAMAEASFQNRNVP